MRLHTRLTYSQVIGALVSAKHAGLVAPDVQFTVLKSHGSRTRQHAFEVQLGVPRSGPYQPLKAGTLNKYGRPQKTRRTTNGGGQNWAATWAEWGWFMAEVYDRDSAARWGAGSWGYFSRLDFNEKTDSRFILDEDRRLDPAVLDDLGRSCEPAVPVRHAPPKPIFPFDAAGADPCGSPPIGVK
jgi:hypothetical protein